MKNDFAKQRKMLEDQEKLKECTFRPKTLAKSKKSNQVPFEVRQQNWLNNKNEKLEIMKKREQFKEITECTFEPEILDPKIDNNYDFQFYDRQLQWLNDLKDQIEFGKEKLFKQQHQEAPKTFISPFQKKDEVQESYLKDYMNSDPTRMVGNIHENVNCGHFSEDRSRNAIMHTNTGSNDLQEFMKQEIVDAQNIFNSLNMIFDAKNQEINISIEN